MCAKADGGGDRVGSGNSRKACVARSDETGREFAREIKELVVRADVHRAFGAWVGQGSGCHLNILPSVMEIVPRTVECCTEGQSIDKEHEARARGWLDTGHQRA